MNSFFDRREAGRMLARRLGEYANRPDVTVFALPRGGTPVAYEVARALRLPLDAFLVRKVYAPGRDDVHLGTITSGGFEQLDDATINARGVDRCVAEREMARARQELLYQERVYRGTQSFPDVRGRTVILVYDGAVSGGSMIAAVEAMRAQGAATVVVAIPVATPNAAESIRRVADRCVCVMTPEPFHRIGIWYDDFAPVSDASVLILLDVAAKALKPVAA
jgi:predicted phosphoribosyltransferase